MQEQFSRTALLLGEEGVDCLADKRVAIFGIGGVGGFVVEALVRCGIGHFLLVDNDTVALSNLNRQIIATYDTIGKYKTQVMKERILSINPQAEVETRECFFLPENADEFDFSSYDYVVDAIDTVTAKLELVMRAQAAGTPIICSMGTGNKLDPTKFQIADIYQTNVCPLARVMRRELKARGVKKLKVLYSTEEAMKPKSATGIVHANQSEPAEKNLCAEKSEPVEKNLRAEKSEPAEKTVCAQIPTASRRSVPGSVAFVPSAAGLIIAGEVIRELVGIK